MRGKDPISLIDAAIMLEDFLALDITLHYPVDLHRLALVLADRFGLPATYDAHYLAVSELMECDYWTADLRLLRQIGRKLDFVRWIGDYPLLAQS